MLIYRILIATLWAALEQGGATARAHGVPAGVGE